MKKWTFLVGICAILAVLFCGALTVSAESNARYDAETKTVTYSASELDISENATVYLAAYSQKEMVGLAAQNVTPGGSVSEMSAKVTKKPERIKVLVFGSQYEPLMAPTVFGFKASGETEELVRIEKKMAEGRIVSVYGLSMYYGEPSNCNRRQVELEYNDGTREYFGTEYLNIPDPSIYLGRTVAIFYENEPDLSYYEAEKIAFQPGRNKEIKIDLDSIVAFSDTSIEYYDENTNKEERVSIISGIPIIHNHTCVNDRISSLLAAVSYQDGYIKLVYSSSDDAADVAFLMTYETIIVGSKSLRNYKIYDYYDSSKTFTLDETDYSKRITFTKDGVPSSFSGIVPNNIVSVALSVDGKWIDVQISSVKKSGTVEEIRSDGSFKLTSGEVFYKLADYCNTETKLECGAYAMFYLDAFGKVGRYVLSYEKSFNYAYLAAAEFTEGQDDGSKAQLKVYVLKKGGAILMGGVYTLKETVKIDNTIYTVSRDINAIKDHLIAAAAKPNINPAIGGDAPDNATYAQPLRFTTTSSGSYEIDRILTTDSNTGTYSASLHLRTGAMSTPIPCTVDRTRLATDSESYTLDANIPILVVPDDRTGGTYKLVSNSYFKKDASYYVQFVNVNDSSQKPAAIYVYGDSTGGISSITEEHVPMLVKWAGTRTHTIEGISQARAYLDLVGVDGTEMTVYYDGRTGTEIFASVVAGDIVRVAADSDGLTDQIEIIATAQSVMAGTLTPLFKVDGTNDDTTDQVDAPFRTLFGLVRSTDGSYINVANSLTSTSVAGEPFAYETGVNVYRVDHDAESKELTVRAAEFSDIEIGTKVMVYTVDGKLMAIIIFDEPVEES